jgi:hypothetical protein
VLWDTVTEEDVVRVGLLEVVGEREAVEETVNVMLPLVVVDCDTLPEVDLEKEGEGVMETESHCEVLEEAVALTETLRVAVTVDDAVSVKRTEFVTVTEAVGEVLNEKKLLEVADWEEDDETETD